MPLTGRFDFRKTFSGKLVLILEDVRALSPLRKGSTRRRWRKATVMDLAATELRPMMDHRSKPNYHVPLRQVAAETSAFEQAAEAESPRLLPRWRQPSCALARGSLKHALPLFRDPHTRGPVLCEA